MSRGLLIAVWLGFVVRALFYCSAVPLWEGFDEYAHFAVIQNVARDFSIPNLLNSNSSREVAESRRLTPSPWLTHDNAAGFLSYEDYWNLSGDERQHRRAALIDMPAAWRSDPADPPLLAWEAQQPPLYYWLASLFVHGGSLPTRVWILRVATALIASLAIPLAFLAGREMFGDAQRPLACAVVAASFPELVITSARVSNEGLAIALGSAAIWLALRRDARWLGVVLGAGLLAKAYFLAFLAAPLIAFWRRWRAMAAAFAICLAIGGWWYVRTFLLTGTLTGEEREVAAHAGSAMSFGESVRAASWIRVADFVTLSHIWLGDWSFLVVRTWMYRAAELILALAIVRAALRARTANWALLATLGAAFLAGLAYHATTGLRTQGTAGTMGYYLYALTAAEAIVLVGGLGRFAGLVAIVFGTIEIFGTWFLQLPYYAGLIEHTGSGALPALRLSRWTPEMFDHLAAIGPGATPVLLEVLAVLSIGAVLANVAIGVSLSRPVSEAARHDAKLRA